MQHHNQRNIKTMWGTIIKYSPALALAVTPLVLTTPAHAADDNTVSIAVDQNAALQPSGTLYKATTNVTVKTGKPYGFNLTMQADTADLINSKDSTHKISTTPSTTPVALNANQWGYSLSNSATTFSAVPAATQPGTTATTQPQPGATAAASTATPAVIADVTKAKPAGCTNPANCTKQVTFAANIDPAKLASGSYSTAITYTATAKPAPKPVFTGWYQRAAKVDPSEVCRSGDNSSSCLVDLDKNMIPVIYTGNENHAEWTSIKWPENPHDPGAWYNYNQKKWANAITVKDPSKYQNKRMVVDQADILGYWVYIPRYTYEVMRRDGTDKPVKEQNFDIKFENTKTPKKRPLACKTGNGKDYRTECNVSRELPLTGGEVSTWATHPAFTFGSKELNGIWFAKFETTGTSTQPTVLPNEAHMSGNYTASYNIGRMYTTAKTLGVADSNNIGGNTDYPIPSPNNHHLAKLSSHMVNNNDWGAATYLSASKYGAGYNKVQINANNANHSNSYGTTGCGSQGKYDDFGALGTPQACGSPDRAYNGTLGQFASTTNNPTGIYDMSGGGWEYVAASYTSYYLNSSSTQGFGLAAHSPYVNTYDITNINSCTFATCGGQALHETSNGTNNSDTAQWNGDRVSFVNSSSPWFSRGGGYGNGSHAGIFYANGNSGNGNDFYNYKYSYHSYDFAFRVALAPLKD